MKNSKNVFLGIVYVVFFSVLICFMIPLMFLCVLEGINIFFGYRFYAPFWYEDIWREVNLSTKFTGAFLWIPILMKILNKKIKAKNLVIVSLVLLMFPFAGEYLWSELSFNMLKKVFNTKTIFSIDGFEDKYSKIKIGDKLDKSKKILGNPFKVIEKGGVKLFVYSKPAENYPSYLFYGVVVDSKNQIIYKFRKFVCRKNVITDKSFYEPVFVYDSDAKIKDEEAIVVNKKFIAELRNIKSDIF